MCETGIDDPTRLVRLIGVWLVLEAKLNVYVQSKKYFTKFEKILKIVFKISGIRLDVLKSSWNRFEIESKLIPSLQGPKDV